MAKFRLPEGARTKAMSFRHGEGRIVLRFNKKGEAKCADKYADAIVRLCPNLELIEESE